MPINKNSGNFVLARDPGRVCCLRQERIKEVPFSTHHKKEFFDVPLGSKFYRRNIFITDFYE